MTTVAESIQSGEGSTFSESQYLKANPDVAFAVRQGGFTSGLDHYRQFGRLEGRPLSPQRTREEKVLAHLDRHASGLEIGPSHRPIAPKRAGFNTKVLDHLDAAGLRAKYAAHGHGVDIDNIEEVDYVWSGEPLSELVGGAKFDWIIASHVIEHTPDLIGFVNECGKMLTQTGVLSLVMPDKRFCFDYFREPTSLATIIDAHVQGAKRHSVGTAADYFLNVARKGTTGAWASGHEGDFELMHTLDDALGIMQRIRNGDYVDLHAWCFTPSSFRLLVEDLHSLDFIGLREAAFFDTIGHEFFVTLGQKGAGPGVTRIDLLRRKERELGETLPPTPRDA